MLKRRSLRTGNKSPGEFQLYRFWGIEPNPTVETLRKAISIVKSEEYRLYLAVGGGSVIDGSKLIAAAAIIEEDAWDLSETIIIQRSTSSCDHSYASCHRFRNEQGRSHNQSGPQGEICFL